MIKRLDELGYIYKHLFGNWYLVRLYANRNNPLHHIILPMRLVEKNKHPKTFTLTEDQITALHDRYSKVT